MYITRTQVTTHNITCLLIRMMYLTCWEDNCSFMGMPCTTSWSTRCILCRCWISVYHWSRATTSLCPRLHLSHVPETATAWSTGLLHHCLTRVISCNYKIQIVNKMNILPWDRILKLLVCFHNIYIFGTKYYPQHLLSPILNNTSL